MTYLMSEVYSQGHSFMCQFSCSHHACEGSQGFMMRCGCGLWITKAMRGSPVCPSGHDPTPSPTLGMSVCGSVLRDCLSSHCTQRTAYLSKDTLVPTAIVSKQNLRCHQHEMHRLCQWQGLWYSVKGTFSNCLNWVYRGTWWQLIN